MPLLISFLVLLVLVYGAGQWHWSRRTAERRAELLVLQQGARTARVDSATLASLPAPVARYVRLVLPPGAEERGTVDVPSYVYLAHEGTMNLGGQWRTFTSNQDVVTLRPGFLWDARVTMAPGIKAYVHDAYVGGKGILHATVVGLITVTNASGEVIDDGEFLRWCAESAWYPAVLLPDQGAEWSALTDTSAMVRLHDGDRVAELTVTFREDGLMGSVRAMRSRETNGTFERLPWEGIWDNYERRDGWLVPITGDVAWITDKGRESYWRGKLQAIGYKLQATSDKRQALINIDYLLIINKNFPIFVMF